MIVSFNKTEWAPTWHKFTGILRFAPFHRQGQGLGFWSLSGICLPFRQKKIFWIYSVFLVFFFLNRRCSIWFMTPVIWHTWYVTHRGWWQLWGHWWFWLRALPAILPNWCKWYAMYHCVYAYIISNQSHLLPLYTWPVSIEVLVWIFWHGIFPCPIRTLMVLATYIACYLAKLM